MYTTLTVHYPAKPASHLPQSGGATFFTRQEVCVHGLTPAHAGTHLNIHKHTATPASTRTIDIKHLRANVTEHSKRTENLAKLLGNRAHVWTGLIVHWSTNLKSAVLW